MALFNGTGCVNFVYPADGSTDFFRKSDILGISTFIDDQDDGYCLVIEVVLVGDTHCTIYGESFAEEDDAADFCEDFCATLASMTNTDNDEDIYLLIGVSDDDDEDTDDSSDSEAGDKAEELPSGYCNI